MLLLVGNWFMCLRSNCKCRSLTLEICINNVCIYHESVIGPASELHHALLLVEGEVLHVNTAVGLVDGGGVPLDPARVGEDRLGHDGHLVVTVRTDSNKFNL